MGKILRLTTKPAKIPILESLERWLAIKPTNTRVQYMRQAKAWSQHLGCKLEEDRAGFLWIKAKHTDALDYCNSMAARTAQDKRHGTISPATIRHHCAVLKSIYDELIAQGLAETNPFTRVVRELVQGDAGARRPHRRVPTDAVKKLIQWVPRTKDEKQDLAIISLFFGAALRRSEVINIRIGDLHTTEKGTTVLTLPQTKAQKVQTVSLPSWCAANVQAWLAVRAKESSAREPLFVRYDSKGNRHPVTDSGVYRWFKRICEEFEIGEWTPHCARVTAITQLLDQGKDHRSVQELSRHASVQMVEKYDRRRVEADESASKDLEYE